VLLYVLKMFMALWLISLLTVAVVAVAASASTSSPPVEKKTEFAVVGYLPEWRYSGANFERCKVAYVFLCID
jgi:hypothetical protein